MKVAYLKSICQRPDLCEGWDVTSPDPILLMYLKAYKNTVNVPVHWSQKRRFLQNKRGVLKLPFKLPDFIEKTGISKLRDVNVNGAAMVIFYSIIYQIIKNKFNDFIGKLMNRFTND